jgi:CDP-glucose 4,6-dehydratase
MDKNMMTIEKQFWKNKNVFMTGHTGFKGSWLALWLQQLGANVIGYSLLPSTPTNLFTEANVSKNMVSIIDDIREYDTLSDAIQTYHPDIIFHLAAQPLVRYSYLHPIETYATNVLGTVHLLEAARNCPSIKAIVNITSDKCYENREWERGYHEEDTLGGHDPYSNSKGCAELVTSAYRKSFFQKDNSSSIGVASARAGNVIGGGDWAQDRLIPDIITSFIQQKNLEIRSPQAIRPWQHVLEPLSGYLLLAEKLYNEPAHYSEAWNFGPDANDAKSVSWIVEHLHQRWDNQPSHITVKPSALHEAHYLKLDCSKAHSKLNWHPKWSLDKALDATTAWYKSWHAKDNVRNICLNQIAEYESA